jgi:hypothetical protein
MGPLDGIRSALHSIEIGVPGHKMAELSEAAVRWMHVRPVVQTVLPDEQVDPGADVQTNAVLRKQFVGDAAALPDTIRLSLVVLRGNRCLAPSSKTACS